MPDTSENFQETLRGIAADYGKRLRGTGKRVVICAGTGCVANGSLRI